MAVQSRASGAGYFSAPIEDTVSAWLLQCAPSHAAMTLLDACVAQVCQKNPIISTEEVITQIMGLVKDNLPNAEWIVAHLGMNHPELILPAVVDLSLKQIHEQCDSFGLPANMKHSATVTAGLKLNFVESVAYIAKFHRRMVQQKMVSPLKNAILALKTRYSLLCVDYLMFTCDKLPDFSGCILEYLAEILDIELLDKTMQTLDKGIEHVDQASIDALTNQAVSLLMKNGPSSLKLFKFLLETHCKTVSKRLSKKFHVHIHNLLHYWLLELQRVAQSRYFSYKLSLTDQLFIMELIENFEFLSELYWYMLIHEQTFFVRFYIRTLCLAEGDVFAAKFILHLMSHEYYRSFKIMEILAIVKEIGLALPNIHTLIIRKISLTLPSESSIASVYLKSLVYLFSLRTDEADYHHTKFAKAVTEKYPQIAKFIAYPNLAVNRTALQFLSAVKINSIIDEAGTIYKINSYLIAFILNVMQRESNCAKREASEKLMQRYLKSLCGVLSTDGLEAFRQLFVTSLFKMSVSDAQCRLFGGTSGKTKEEDPSTYISLLQQNRYINRTKCSSTPLPLLRANNLKQIQIDENNNNENTWKAENNISFIIGLVTVVAGKDFTDTKEEPSNQSSALLDHNTMACLAKAVAEFACGQTAYTVNQWGDLTLERPYLDRNIKLFNLFDNNPILWALVDLLAQARPMLCHILSVLSSLLHVIITFWESNRSPDTERNAKNLFYSKRLLAMMEESQFIPKQLAILQNTFEDISPFELASILTICWRYVQDNYPDVGSFTVNASSAGKYPSRSFMKGIPQQYLDSIHTIFLTNILSLGHMFPRYLSLQTVNTSF
ncbi:uncharacterized protein LOC134838939 isoform X3 [Symsagittifera roscoffensis]